jgi:hypothetical protein
MSYLIRIDNPEKIETVLHQLMINQEINEYDLDSFRQIDENSFIGDNDAVFCNLAGLTEDCYCEEDDEIEYDMTNTPPVVSSLFDWYTEIRNNLIESDIYNYD